MARFCFQKTKPNLFKCADIFKTLKIMTLKFHAIIHVFSGFQLPAQYDALSCSWLNSYGMYVSLCIFRYTTDPLYGRFYFFHGEFFFPATILL